MCAIRSRRLHACWIFHARWHTRKLDTRFCPPSQLFQFHLFWQPHSPLCFTGLVSNTIDAEDGFSSRRGGWCGHGNHAYVHAWCMDWRRWSPARFSKSSRRSKVDPIRASEVEAKSNSSSSPVRSPGVVRNKTDAQVAYGLGFVRSIYGWKQNFIELPMALVSCQNSSWVNRNRRNKLTSKICQGAVSPVWWVSGPSWGRPDEDTTSTSTPAAPSPTPAPSAPSLAPTFWANYSGPCKRVQLHHDVEEWRPERLKVGPAGGLVRGRLRLAQEGA
jgi:hypothetical protein